MRSDQAPALKGKHTDTLRSENALEQGPALCCGFSWSRISLLFGLWAELRILIIMAQGHGDLSVCVLGNYTENKNNANSGKPFIKDLLCARPCTDSWETVMNKRGKLLCPCGWREQLMNELHK